MVSNLHLSAGISDVRRRTLMYHCNPRPLAEDDEPRNLQYAKVILTTMTITVTGAAEIDPRQPQQPNQM